MNRSDKPSILGTIFECLEMIWEPAGQAFKVQKELGIRSLKETPAALERANYEVCYVDLPQKVSGFAEIIAGKPHVALNRAKPSQHLHYTMAHELGHHILHLSSVREPGLHGFPRIGDPELEADLFATSWLVLLQDDTQRNDVLYGNPEPSRTFAIYFLLSVMVVLSAVLANFTLRDLKTK